VHEQRAACLFALRKPSLPVLGGFSTTHLPESRGFLQCLRNVRPQTACAQAEWSLQAA